MALRKTFTKTIVGFDGQLVCRGTYWKVLNVNGDKNRIEYNLGAFVGDEQVYGLIGSFVPSTDESSSNFIKQAYEYIKTLPEFENAEDC